MTRKKKKVPSVAGEKFVPIKVDTRPSADKEEYRRRKQQNLAKKKRQRSVAEQYQEEKQLREELESEQRLDKNQHGKGKTRAQRQSRLKQDPALVARRSAQLLERQAEDSSSSDSEEESN